MKILQINKFLYPKGGDAIVMLSTGKLLSENGHEVKYWGMHDQTISKSEFYEHLVNSIDYNKKFTIIDKIRTSSHILYSFEAKTKIKKVLEQWKPDIVHLHNFAHQISPSILEPIKKLNIPIVMTIHDYKLVCPVYTLQRNGIICQKCNNGHFGNCFKYKCTKNSRAKSLVNTTEMFLHHKFLHLYDLIDVFVSPSIFLIDKLHEMGFKREIEHISNFVNFDEYIPQYKTNDDYFLYFGRISQEKGVETLIKSMTGIDTTLKIIGTGPLELSLKTQIKGLNIEFLGYKIGEELKNIIKNSKFVVVPSEWYENNPLSVIEAFALGKPVVGSDIGGIPELVKEDETGCLVQPGNVDDLRSKILSLLKNDNKIFEMGKNCRKLVEQKFKLRIIL